MLGKRSPQRSLFDVAFLYEDLIPEDSFYGFLGDKREQLFRDEDFEELYCLSNGRPSVAPSLLATALLLQSHDRASDQEAWERSKFDARWKHALGVPFGETPFAKSTLQLFRAKLLVHDKVEAIFRRSLEYASEEGFLRGKTIKAVVDTTPIFGRGAVKDTYNLLADGIRQVIRALAVAASTEPETWAAEVGYERYFSGSVKGQADVDWDEETSRRRFLRGIVEDAEGILQRVRDEQDEEIHERLAAAAALLSDILQQDIEADVAGPKLREGVAKGRIVSVHDPEMRHGRKSSRVRFDGHKGAIAVDPESQLITAVDVVDASSYDGDTALPLTEATEENLGCKVEETIGDCAYGDGTTRREFDEADRKLVAKVPRPRRGKRIPKEDFAIDLEAGSCTCPVGHVTTDLRPAGSRTDRRGRRVPVRHFRFSDDVCRECPLRESCTSSRSGGRTITVHPRENELRQARAFQQSEAAREYKMYRQTVEHRLARLMQLGVRQSRYFGQAKTLLQLSLAATVANLTLVAAHGKAG